jgi:hypothetical protein
MTCVSGFTLGGYYRYFDCCGNKVEGLAATNFDVCLDYDYSASTLGISANTASTCSVSCTPAPLSYNFQVTGTCYSATGSLLVNGLGGTSPYTLDPVTPIGSGLATQTGVGPFNYTGLTGGTYVFRINDSLGLQNNELYFNVIVSPCFRVNIYNVSGTTCGLENGTLSISATSTAAPYTIFLYKDGNLDQVQTTNTLPYIFTNLGDGIYYGTVVDYGSVSANTANGIITTSTGVDFGFWKVNTSNCVIDKGKLSVTGVTGTGPYTYLWSNGETTSIITGLTEGTYSCTVTDSLGCQTTKSETIISSDPLGVGLVTSVTPSCFSSDGSLTYTLTGGTRPLYYSASTGEVGYTFSDTFTITNLSSGTYITNVRDANFCEINLNGFLSPQNGFSVVDTILTKPNCNQNNGSIYVEIQGLGGFYNYILSAQTLGVVYSNISQDQFYTFTNLQNDTYLLYISGTGTNCDYNTTLTLDSEVKFSISANTSGATCNNSNGEVTINVSSGYTGVLDYILSDGQTLLNTTLSSYTFNNLVAGNYTVTVADSTGCTASESFTITTTGNLVFNVNTTGCTQGNDGSAQITVYDGNPPFTYQWSNNVCCSQTGSTISGLTAGTYTINVTDSNGCSINSTFNIFCTGTLVSGYQTINICNDEFSTTSGNKRGFYEMLNEGFLDITSGLTGCTLVSAIFNCEIEINGSAFTQTFYTATTLNDFPQDTLWQSTIENILSGITEIGSYSIDILNNTINIKSNCNGDYDPLSDAPINIGLEIIYDVVCTGPITPTPTPTLTPTPTPTLTPISCSMSGYTFEINQP